jgi:hypothetical protein
VCSKPPPVAILCSAIGTVRSSLKHFSPACRRAGAGSIRVGFLLKCGLIQQLEIIHVLAHSSASLSGVEQPADPRRALVSGDCFSMPDPCFLVIYVDIFQAIRYI